MTVSNSHPNAALTSGALPFLNPTTRYHAISSKEKESPDEYYHVWRSRDNRKGRHAAVVTRSAVEKKAHRPTNAVAEILRGIAKLFTRYPVWDVSYDVAAVFTLGKLKAPAIPPPGFQPLELVGMC